MFLFLRYIYFFFLVFQGNDEDFTGDGDDESDVEETIEEQETHEKKDYSEELHDLKAEGISQF